PRERSGSSGSTPSGWSGVAGSACGSPLGDRLRAPWFALGGADGLTRVPVFTFRTCVVWHRTAYARSHGRSARPARAGPARRPLVPGPVPGVGVHGGGGAVGGAGQAQGQRRRVHH